MYLKKCDAYVERRYFYVGYLWYFTLDNILTWMLVILPKLWYEFKLDLDKYGAKTIHFHL